MTVGSGNVFADLGLPDADEMLVKSALVIEIERTIARRGLTQSEAASLMGIDQPKVSHLLRGRFRGFSIERLTMFLARLGRDVDIVVRRAKGPRHRGHVRVKVGR